MTRRLRLFWALLLLALLLAAGLPLGGFGLLASEGGTRWLLRQLLEITQNDEFSLQIDEINGTLLRELRLGGVRLAVAGARVDVETLAWRWRPDALLDERLHVELLQLTGLRVRPPAPDDTPAQAPTLPDLAFPLVLQLDRLQVERLSVLPAGADADPIEIAVIGLTALLAPERWTVSDLELRGMGAELAGRLGLVPRAPHELDGRLDASVAVPGVATVRAALELSGPALEPAFALTVSEPARLQADGSADLRAVQPAFAVEAHWPQLDWPLQGPPQVQTRDGRLRLEGTVEAYRLELAAQVAAPDLPGADVELQGQGTPSGLELAPLRIQALNGELTATGPVRWAPEPTWDLAVQARDLDPGVHFADWPGRLGAELQLGGRLAAQGPQIQARIARLEGRLRDQPVRASGALDYRAGQLHAEALDLASGPNRLRLDGRADQQFDLGFDLDAPDLAALYPGLGGRLQGQGRLTGTPASPSLVTRLDGRGLAYAGYALDELQLQADWGGERGRAVLHAAGLQGGGTTLSRIAADLAGSVAAHQLQVEASAPDYPASVRLEARGGLDAALWSGRLLRLDLTEPVLGEWTLDAPVALQLGAAKVRGDSLCLTQPGHTTRLCAGGGWTPEGGLDASGQLRGLDLGRFADRLPGGGAIEGRLAGQFRVAGPPERLVGDLELAPSDGRLVLQAEGEPLDVPYRKAKVNAHYENDEATVGLTLELGEGGRADGRLSLGAAPDRALGGRLEAVFPDLRLVEGFVPALEAVRGRLRLDLALAGTLARPQARGGLHVEEAGARLPAAGLELTAIVLQLQGDVRGPLAITGGVSSGAGRIELDGTLDPAASGGPRVDLRMSGADFQAARLPEAVVDISPDLRLQGQGPYHLSGKLLVPKARIELKELPGGSVAVSDDVVVVGEEAPPGRGGPGNLTAKVRIELGKQVTFKGFGLSTGLSGVLDAAVDAKGPRLHGKIELRDGAYKAYGQDLEVAQGRLLFAGPTDNPHVDLKAVRTSLDGRVKAYLAMSGPLAEPRPRVYSEPARPEAEALAYLLTGRALDQAGKQEGGDIAAAALSLGLSKGEPLLQQMGDRLGLDELLFESGAEGVSDSSLILGKYLNPDLYLGYTQGLFDPQGAVLLRLRLSEHLDLESRAGNEQSVDLFYRIEHD